MGSESVDRIDVHICIIDISLRTVPLTTDMPLYIFTTDHCGEDNRTALQCETVKNKRQVRLLARANQCFPKSSLFRTARMAKESKQANFMRNT